ncbi:MAG: YhdH/YhfP family quinone oxidoreductase [Bdellovibrionales bacterium]|nr:YhdH/YhfP family quinone oxidoreductase [Bdellovibrionales bacterium]
MAQKYRSLMAQNLENNIDDIAHIRCEWVLRPIPEVPAGSVQIHVNYSSINYKDALAITGKGKILRHLPLVPGIDACGTVVKSHSPLWKEGDHVLVTGCGIGEHVDGGLSEFITVPQEWVIAKPSKLSLKECMILGTAGFTAGLAVHQLEKNDLSPQNGEVIVTGASGGVGSLSLLLLKSLGYRTVALTRKKTLEALLKSYGADRVEIVPETPEKLRPLETGKWAGAIDNVGGQILENLLPQMLPHSSIASIGLAQSAKISTTVFPFILRGVNLLGASSGTCPRPLREKIWQELNDASVDWSKALTQTLTPEEVLPYAESMIAGKTHGRAIVDMTP